tara:strand:- start:2085 stop:2648 length:564 start_codon:yes stop_codon:yes gene_type:complete
MKKAAMFGLDARIALAIFGALSVISGAALYSAIQDAKLTSTYVQMQEVAKSLESFYIDTGSFPASFPSGSSYRLNLAELVSSTKANWQGPYTSLAIDSTYYLLNSETHERVTLMVSQKDSWGSCDAGDICEGWVLFYRDNGKDFLKSMDAKFDDGDPATGNIKGWTSSGTLYAMLLKVSYINGDVSS